MSKHSLILARELREEHYRDFKNMDDRELCEMVHAHFDSHPTLPGEKSLKDGVEQALVLVTQSNSPKMKKNPLQTNTRRQGSGKQN